MHKHTFGRLSAELSDRDCHTELGPFSCLAPEHFRALADANIRLIMDACASQIAEADSSTGYTLAPPVRHRQDA
jgi:hypothetical protein